MLFCIRELLFLCMVFVCFHKGLLLKYLPSDLQYSNSFLFSFSSCTWSLRYTSYIINSQFQISSLPPILATSGYCWIFPLTAFPQMLKEPLLKFTCNFFIWSKNLHYLLSHNLINAFLWFYTKTTEGFLLSQDNSFTALTVRNLKFPPEFIYGWQKAFCHGASR